MKKQAIGTMIRAKQAGFTAVETAVVIAIIAVLHGSFQWGASLLAR